MVIQNFNEYSPKTGNMVYIDKQSRVIGNVFLDDDVSIWPMSVLRGDMNSIHIGKRSNIQDGTIIHENHDGPIEGYASKIFIGEDVTIGHRVMLHGCTIKSKCIIGIGSIVLDNAIINENVMLGANSLVAPGKELKSGYLYLGSPARIIRELTEEEINHIPYSAKHYVDLKNEYLKHEENN